MTALEDIHRIDLQQSETIDQAAELANTGLANAGLANVRLTNTGPASVRLTNTSPAITEFIDISTTDAARGIHAPAEPLSSQGDATGKGGGDGLWHPSTLASASDTQRADQRS